jgi:hypothetical protein
MNKIIILCFLLVFAISFADQKYSKETIKTPDLLSQELHQAKKAGPEKIRTSIQLLR